MKHYNDKTILVREVNDLMNRRTEHPCGPPGLEAQSEGRSAAALGRRTFARHFAEMIVVMLLGMGVLEGVAMLGFAAAGSRLTDQPGTVRVVLMGLSMTVPMVVWMRYRGHSARRNVEMAASMLLPAVARASQR